MAIVRNADGRVIGDCGLHFVVDDPGQMEIGITLEAGRPRVGPEAGLATEALRGVVGLAFGALGMRRVFARVDVENARAAALLVRVGFRREEHMRRAAWFKGAWCDEDVYGMVGEEWRSGATDEREQREISRGCPRIDR
jgi:aminoglycoside 6'-N-acetyltransferase